MIYAKNIELSFGSQVVFDNLSFELKESQHIGLIGANGSGKSTLLEAIVGLQPLDDGIITTSKNKKIAYLAQDVVLSSDRTILAEALTAFEDLEKVKQRLAVVESQLEQTNADLLAEYAMLHEKLIELEPDRTIAETKKMLQGLGFKLQDFDNPVSTLSVGWRMRIVLAKLLLQKADFYLFDEPTNHLDIFAKDWFLDFLRNADFGFMLVCHERYFLDTVCDQILELERGKATFYYGNYTDFITVKQEQREKLLAAYEQQQKEIRQKEETIAKFRSGTRAKQAQSMIKQLDKVERIVLPPGQRAISINFPPLTRSGKVTLNVANVGYAFGPKEIFRDVSFEIERGQKVALVASNGGGKSTLLNLIAKKLPMQTGSIEFGVGVTWALFDQDQNAALDLNKTVLQNIEQSCPAGTTTATVRAFLGAFLFSGDDVNKKISVLSGGEKNRVGMVRVLLARTNMLLLDEPTNHLDLDAKRILLKALRDYEGTILFVSHDRAFLNDLATRVIELTPKGALSFEGNYDQFLYYKKNMGTDSSGNKITSETGDDSSAPETAYDKQKRAKSLERKIQQFELKISACENAFADFEYGTPEFSANEKELDALREQLQLIMKEWESINS